MRALLKLIANDALLLWRTGYFLVSAIIIIFFAWGASRLSLPPVSAVADFIAALALFLTVMTPLLTVGIMLISERTEGVLTSMAVMPVGLWKSILSRTIVIASLTTVEMFVLFLCRLRRRHRYWPARCRLIVNNGIVGSLRHLRGCAVRHAS